MNCLDEPGGGGGNLIFLPPSMGGAFITSLGLTILWG